MTKLADLPIDDRAPSTDGDAPLDAYSRIVAAIADEVGPAVVRVENRSGSGRRGGIGSGFLIAPDGLVLTNSHVVGGAQRVRLTFAEGGDAEAVVLGDDLSLANPGASGLSFGPAQAFEMSGVRACLQGPDGTTRSGRVVMDAVLQG